MFDDIESALAAYVTPVGAQLQARSDCIAPRLHEVGGWLDGGDPDAASAALNELARTGSGKVELTD